MCVHVQELRAKFLSFVKIWIYYQTMPYDDAACMIFTRYVGSSDGRLPPHGQTVSDGSATMGEGHSFTVSPRLGGGVSVR